jgi:hypothetical protein
VTSCVDPLDAFAPWPRSAEGATPDALLRHALVRAVAADALAREGCDVARQNAWFVGRFGQAVLLRELAAAGPARSPLTGVLAEPGGDPSGGTIAARGVAAPGSVQTAPDARPEGPRVAERLWRLLGDGADASALAARWLRDCGIDPDSVGQAAVDAYRARRVQAWPQAKAGVR